jgi:sugar phosphate isomerase/epimerase
LRFRDGFAPVPAWPLADVLDAAVAAGFAQIGLDVFTVAGYPAAAVRQDLLARGLRCSDVGVLQIGETDVREPAEELARLADAVGAPVCIAALPAPLPRDVAVRQLDAAVDVLARAGARVALEFAAYGGLTRLADAVELCDAVGRERCGLLLDAWHFFRTGAPWELLRSLEGGQVALVHVNDGATDAHPDPVVDGRSRRRPPGAGDFPLVDLAAALDEIGYDGPLSVEVLGDDVRERPPAEGARLLMRALETTWPTLRPARARS